MSVYTWKIGGEAGFGIMTTGLLFSKIASQRGRHIFDFIEYPSLIRGGHNTYDATFSLEKVHVLKPEIDLLVCLNKETYLLHKQKVSETGYIMYDPNEFAIEEKEKGLEVPFTDILAKLKGQIIMKNTIALGASLAFFGADLNELHAILEKQFGRKGQEIVEVNQEFAKQGFDVIMQTYQDKINPVLEKKQTGEKLIMTGNEAFSYGTVAADCRFYSAYPMTPSSTVLSTLAGWQKKTGMVVRHAEDEIAAINSALGASFSGVRSAVGTSGGGFALMTEAVSLAGIAEQPIVIFISQRPGPATGMPTWTEQGDLLFAVHAGHGEFPKIVLAPGDHEEMIQMSVQAFELADYYQTPVIVLSDMLLSESHSSIDKKNIQNCITKYIPTFRKKAPIPSQGYKRYEFTEDGISPYINPGTQGVFFQVNSYEHLEDGHTTESADERIKQVNKRSKKQKTYLTNHFITPHTYGLTEGAKTVFVGWGSTKGVMLEAQKQLKEKNIEVGIIHFTHVYPLEKKKIKSLFDSPKRFILVENNSQAQFGKLLQMETGIAISEQVLRYDGRPITVSELLQITVQS